MEIGRYLDGRDVSYDDRSVLFTIGGVAVTPAQVRAYVQAGQITWANNDVGPWFDASFPAAPAIVPASRQPRIALWVIVGVLTGALLCGGGIWWAWSSGMFEANAANTGETATDSDGGGQADSESGLERDALDDEIERLTRESAYRPSDREIMVALGNAYFDRAFLDFEAPTADADWLAAIEHYASALDVQPDDPPVRTDMGICYHQLGDLDSAEREYRAVIAGHPDFTMAHSSLGFVLESRGDMDGAVAIYRDVLEMPGDDDLAERGRELARERLDELDPE